MNNTACLVVRLVVSVICLSLLVSTPLKAESFRIAAASSLQFALDEVIEVYRETADQQPPTVVYGSSGNLFRQIMQGAPFDLFLSARGELTEKIFAANKSEDAGVVFGNGRLVLLFTSSDDKQQGLAEILTTEVINNNRRLALANPAHAPYGRAARQVLESLELWDEVSPNIVNGEQVSQATRFVVTGAAPYGLVSLSLALSPVIAAKTDYHLIDQSLHEPIELRAVRLSTAAEGLQQFYDFILSSEKVSEIFKRYGLRE